MDFVPFFWKLSIKLSSVAVAASLLWASGCNPLCVPSAGETTTERERRPPNWWLPGWNNTVHGWFIRWRRETRTSDDVHDPQEIEQQSNSSLVFFCLFHFFLFSSFVSPVIAFLLNPSMRVGEILKSLFAGPMAACGLIAILPDYLLYLMQLEFRSSTGQRSPGLPLWPLENLDINSTK